MIDLNQNTKEPTKGLSLSGQQRRLYDALMEEHEGLASMYLGGLLVLNSGDNPERFPLAAHAFRELMEKLPLYRDVPVKGRSLGETVREFAGKAKQALVKSQIRRSTGWQGEIDRHLVNLLEETERFLDWYDKEQPSRSERMTNMIRKFDPYQRPLPGPISSRLTKAWKRWNEYFQKIAHHGDRAIQEEFLAILASLEEFLLDQLRPRTFDDHTLIDLLIQEGESDAKS